MTIPRTQSILVMILSLIMALGMTSTALAQGHGQGQGQAGTYGITGDVEEETEEGLLEGTVDVTNIDVNEAGDLVADGTFEGILGGEPVSDTFEDVPLNGTDTCPILDLTLGPLDLDLLGLVVQLDTVQLDIFAERGPGNLLGNLLCAVTGLLDGPGQGVGNAIDNLIGRINNLLG